MRTRFGTDGVRGEYGTGLTDDDAWRLGRAAGTVLAAPRWHVGRDTRLSGGPLSRAFTAGLAGAGRGAVDLGEVPSGAVAHMAASREQPGVMITASHNPYRDNGIKIFSEGGRKLPDEKEREVEAEAERLLSTSPDPGANGSTPPASPAERALYPDFVLGQLEGRDYRSLRLAVDCANGAASTLAPRLLEAAGATVRVIGAEPDGMNINVDSGSTHPEGLMRLVAGGGFDLGLAFDGDADRLLAVDETGRIVDGDQIMAIVALARSRAGRLPGQGIVATLWSNSGLRRGMAAAGITFAESGVGDKAVAEEMAARGFALGGEQSGHIIFGDLLPVGDGLQTAVQLLNVVHDSGRPLGALAAAAMTKLPQRTQNVTVAAAPRAIVAALEDYRRATDEALAGEGRLVLRASGTESVVRVMAEAATDDALVGLVDDAVARVRAAERSDVAAAGPR